MVHIDDLLRRINKIEEATAPERKPEDQIISRDEFTKKKKEIAAKVKEIRKELKAREDLMDRDEARAAEMSQSIRNQIKAVKEDAAQLQKMQRQEARKNRKATGDKADTVAARAEIVSLVFQHIAECENWERRRASERVQNERNDLMDGGSKGGKSGYGASSGFGGGGYEMTPVSGGGGGGDGGYDGDAFESNLPDFEDIGDDLQQIRERDADIEQDLKHISSGVQKLKNIAIDMNEEITMQNQMIDSVQTKVENVNAKVETLNQKMDKTLKGMMKGDRFLVNFVLIAILLALIGFIASMFF